MALVAQRQLGGILSSKSMYLNVASARGAVRMDGSAQCNPDQSILVQGVLVPVT